VLHPFTALAESRAIILAFELSLIIGAGIWTALALDLFQLGGGRRVL